MRWFSIFVFSLMILSFASAAGVSSPYWDENPLEMSRGEVKVIELSLQNMVGEDDIVYVAELVKGLEIASIDEDTYNVPAGTSNEIAELKIKIPKDTVAGTVFPVRVEFKSAAPNNDGMVAIGTGSSITFDVIVGEEIVGMSLLCKSLIALGLVLVILIVLHLTIPKKKAKKKKQKAKTLKKSKRK